MNEDEISSTTSNSYVENNNIISQERTTTATAPPNAPIGPYLQELYLYFICNLIEALEHILIATLVYVTVCLVIYILLFRPKISRRFKKCNYLSFPQCKRVLVVTAHPDDESMFFGPTILSLSQRANCEVHLLCLSNGNFAKKGKIRQAELWNACKHLNIKDENITVINATHLQDDPSVAWKSQVIAKQIIKQAHSLDIDAIITFDKDGVSHHPNHSAIFYASTSIFLAGLIPEGCRVFTLDSINVCRKYVFLFDLILSLIISSHWCILNWSHFRQTQRAMHAHQSQMVWFRKLYILFSRYMIINTLREMNITDAELEMQIAESKNS